MYYLEPQTRLPEESVTGFADRVKKLIAKRARLVPVPWDGYLKYYRPRPSFLEHRQQVVANMLRFRFNLTDENETAGEGAAEAHEEGEERRDEKKED